MRHSMKITWQTTMPNLPYVMGEEKLILWMQFGNEPRHEFNPPLRVPRSMSGKAIVRYLVTFLPTPQCHPLQIAKGNGKTTTGQH